MAPPNRAAQETLLRGAVGASCPIELGVWNAYESEPGQPIDLLIRIRQDRNLSPPLIARSLAQVLGESAADAAAPAIVRLVGDYMSVRLGFGQLFTYVLPLTSWRTVLLVLSTYSPEVVAAELRVAQSDEVFLDPVALDLGLDTTPPTSEQRWRARWLLLVLDRLARASGLDPRGVLDAAVERLVADEPTAVSSVGVNRPVVPAVFMSRTTIKADAAEQLFDIDCERITWAVIDTGIDATHPSFDGPTGSRVVASYDIPGARAALDAGRSGQACG